MVRGAFESWGASLEVSGSAQGAGRRGGGGARGWAWKAAQVWVRSWAEVLGGQAGLAGVGAQA